MPHVFLSYVREDTAKVDRLTNELTKHGVEVWLDKNDIKPGAKWKDAIRNAIEDGDYFIACFSDNYVTRTSRTKTYMNEELQLALDELRQYGPNRAWFIPVRLSECAIPSLSISARETLLDIQWVDLFQTWEDGVRTILNVIKPLPPEVTALMHSFASADRSIRTRALQELRTIADPRTVSAIAPLLADGDKAIAQTAATIIGEVGDASAVPELVSFISSAEPDTRIKPPPKDDRYDLYDTTKSMRHYRTARAYATEALGDIGDRAATTFLVKALKDPEFHVCSAAAQALDRIGDSAALPNLLSYLEDPDEDVCSNASRALGGIGDATAVPALIEVLRDQKRGDETRLNAATALGRIGDSGAVPSLIEFLRDFEIATHTKGSVVASALRDIGGSSALPLLFEDVRSADPQMCEIAVVTLGVIGDPQAIPVLIEALRDPALVVHIHALGEAVGRFKAALPSLISALRDTGAVVRRRAAYALEVMCCSALQRDYYREVSPGYASVEPALIEALSDPDAGVRARSAHALGHIERECRPSRDLEENEPVMLALTRSWDRENDRRVQRVLIKALEVFNASGARAAVNEAFSRRPKDPDIPFYVDWDSFEKGPEDH